MLYQSQVTTTATTLRKEKIPQLEFIGVLRHPDCPEMSLIGRKVSAVQSELLLTLKFHADVRSELVGFRNFSKDFKKLNIFLIGQSVWK